MKATNYLNYIFARLKEPSTYRGLAILGGIVGVSIDPSQWNAIAAAAAGVIGLVEVFRREKPAK
jgi:hypothetical protein